MFLYVPAVPLRSEWLIFTASISYRLGFLWDLL